MEISLSGRTAIVTGGSKGIGYAIATRFVNSGADVMICARGKEALDAAVTSIGAQAASATTIALAPDRAREGTNGICLPASCAFDFSFGQNSFATHLDRVRTLHMHAAVVERVGLAFDVDLPVHLSELAALQTVADSCRADL